MIDYKSKLPEKVRKSLAKELKKLFDGNEYSFNINVPYKIRYYVAWLEDNGAQFNMYGITDSKKTLYDLVDKKLNKLALPKVKQHNKKIKDFNNKMEKICKKYKDADFYLEFDLLVEDYKIFSNKW